MKDNEMYDLKFPIGEFTMPKNYSNEIITIWIDEIASFPEKTKNLVSKLSKTELNYRYRPDGWTIKQVVHHCADSHMNCLIRFKLALTEDSPTIRPYFEDRWAELPDSLNDDLTDTLLLLTGLHAKLAMVLKNLSESDLQRVYEHPEYGTKYKLAEVVGTYAWHCNHHFAHIENALKTKDLY